MDNYKLLTSKEIEELKRLHLVVTQDMINFPERAPHYYEHFCALMFDAMPILLSKLTPPPDAAVREVVERENHYRQEWLYVKAQLVSQKAQETCINSLREENAALRAVQAPRLTREQVRAALSLLSEMDKMLGEDIQPEDDRPAALAMQRFCAAFPEAFAGGVGRG